MNLKLWRFGWHIRNRFTRDAKKRFHRAQAIAGGTFIEPCPDCGTEFYGWQAARGLCGSIPDPITPGLFLLTCPTCKVTPDTDATFGPTCALSGCTSASRPGDVYCAKHQAWPDAFGREPRWIFWVLLLLSISILTAFYWAIHQA